MSDQIKDKNGQPIKEGDTVYTPFRGGKHEGEVDKIATTKEEADEEGVKNPPKVSYFRSSTLPHCLGFVLKYCDHGSRVWLLGRRNMWCNK